MVSTPWWMLLAWVLAFPEWLELDGPAQFRCSDFMVMKNAGLDARNGL
jgi:hypothetical protein